MPTGYRYLVIPCFGARLAACHRRASSNGHSGKDRARAAMISVVELSSREFDREKTREVLETVKSLPGRQIVLIVPEGCDSDIYQVAAEMAEREGLDIWKIDDAVFQQCAKRGGHLLRIKAETLRGRLRRMVKSARKVVA
jgi:hypothetical protein